MIRSLLMLILIAAMPALAQASAQVELGTSHSPGDPLAFRAGTVSGEPMLIDVLGSLQSGSASDLENKMSAWQVSLAIRPEAGATGELQFHSAAEPSGYVFTSVDHFGITVNPTLPPLPYDQFVAFDFNYPFSGGIEVPTSDIDNRLMSIDFASTSDASGTFDIVALLGAGSEWTDSALPHLMGHQFVNNADLGSVTTIGQVLVLPIPEPSTILLGWTAAMGLAICRRPAVRRGWTNQSGRTTRRAARFD